MKGFLRCLGPMSQIPEPFAIAWKLWPKAKLGLGLPVPAALPQVIRARREPWRGQPGALRRKAVKLASRHRLVVDDEINLARAGLLQREEGRARGILDTHPVHVGLGAAAEDAASHLRPPEPLDGRAVGAIEPSQSQDRRGKAPLARQGE